jgi:hypothetical protein
LLGRNDLLDMIFFHRPGIVRECVGRIRLDAPGRRGCGSRTPALLDASDHRRDTELSSCEEEQAALSKPVFRTDG